MTEELSKELVQTIINWVIQSLAEGSAAFVTKKLCAALVTYFIHFPHFWTHSLRHFIYCLDIGHATPLDRLDDNFPTAPLVESLDPQKLKVAIWFAMSLVEEVGKTDMNSTKYMPVHDQAVKNGPDVACLLARGFSQTQDSTGSSIQSDSLSCYQSWILYAQRISSSNSHFLLNPLRQLVDSAMQCFTSPQLFPATAELFSDVLSNYSTFFTPSHYESLSSMFDSPWAEEHYNRLLLSENHEEDGISFGLLMLAYGDARVDQLMTSTSINDEKFLSKLAGLLAAKGYLVGEDAIFVPALEFWSTFVETMIDAVYTPDDDDDDDDFGSSQNAQRKLVWKHAAEQHLRGVVMHCWRKIQWPPVEVFAEWDSSERAGFSDARKDVADFLQSVFTINGGNLVEFFADLFLESLKSQAWPEVEASIFCLGSLSDCISENADMDGPLAKVFGSAFFTLMSDAPGGGIPLRLRQTGLQLIERYKEYFERHADYLPDALNLLFVAVDDHRLGSHSARAIASLCLSCRGILTGEVEAFIGQYQRIRTCQQVLFDSLAEERIVLAISGIIQACPQEDDRRWDVFERMYGFIRADFERAVRLNANPGLLDLKNPDYLRGVVVDHSSNATWDRFHAREILEGQGCLVPPGEIALQIALRGLRCLSNMAKGMQDTVERVVDLDDDETRPLPQGGRLALIQSDIITLLAEIRRNFPASGEVVESICSIYRAGFSETEPGPFVFPPDIVTDFFVSQGGNSGNMTTPRLGTLLSTACSFVGSLYRGPKAVVRRQLERLLPWVISLLEGMGGRFFSLCSFLFGVSGIFVLPLLTGGV